MDVQVKVNGSSLDPYDDFTLLGVEVDFATNMPVMFALRFGDFKKGSLFGPEKFDALDGSKFKIGAKVEIKAKEYGGFMASNLAKNLEVVSIEPIFGENGITQFVVRGYDKSHRMRRGTQAQTYLKMSDADVIKKICGKYGVKAKVKDLSTKHDYLVQHNQSDWDFIQARAELFGACIRVDNDGIFNVVPVDNKGFSKTELTYGDDLLTFQPRVSAATQVKQLEVFGYDSDTGKAVKSKITVKNALNGASKLKSEPKKGVQGSSSYTLTQYPSVKTAVAKQFAEGIAARIGMESVEATGSCLGKPDLCSGSVVDIKGVGKRFSGSYLLTGVRHKLLSNGHYISEFRVANHATFRDLVSKQRYKVTENRIEGVVVGVVTNIKDEQKIGRVKVKFPWLGEEIESEWARVATPMASTKAGIFFPLAINDEVLVAFEHGDPNRPYVVGSLYSKKIKFPNEDAIGEDKVKFLTFKGRSGHYIEFSEEEGKEAISIMGMKDKSYLKFDTNKGNLEIKMAEDIKIACKNLSIETKGKINVKAMQDIGIKTNTKFMLVAQQKAIIKGGMSVELATNSGKSVKIGPASVNINAGALEVM